MRAALDDTVSGLEQRMQNRLDQRDRVSTAVASEIGLVGAELGGRVAAFERTLERVQHTCDLAVRTVQSNRVERLALLEAIDQLAARLPKALEPAEHDGAGLRVVGGTVGPDDSQESGPGTDVAVRVPAAHPAAGSRHVMRLDGVEVRCRFDGDHWVGGFEVSQVIRDAEGVRYRIRRRADGYELPRLFSSDDVRDVDPPHLHEVPRT